MSTASPPAAADAYRAGTRLPLRLGLALALGLLWLAPWADVQAATTAAPEREAGFSRTGAPALAALVALWGLSLTSMGAGTRRGLQAGEAFTSAALCGAVTALLLAAHPWVPGAGKVPLWLPIFLPLGGLAALDGLTRLRSQGTRGEIAAVRVGAGLFAALALAADRQGLPAVLAAWVAAAPLAFLAGRSLRSARLAVEALIVLAALAAGFAPSLQGRLLDVRAPLGGLFLTAYLWSALAALVVLTGVAPFFAPRDEPVPEPAR